MIKGEGFAIWRWDKLRWIIEVYTPVLAAKINGWSFTQTGGYGVNHFRRQFYIPNNKVRFACRVLGSPIPKNANRVRSGKQAAAHHPVGRGRCEKKTIKTANDRTIKKGGLE